MNGALYLCQRCFRRGVFVPTGKSPKDSVCDWCLEKEPWARYYEDKIAELQARVDGFERLSASTTRNGMADCNECPFRKCETEHTIVNVNDGKTYKVVRVLTADSPQSLKYSPTPIFFALPCDLANSKKDGQL